ncbi:unnamed protein product [Absidia cylindrospora]
MAMNRPEYRDAKTPRAVTVYTVAQELRHVVLNVPALSGEETIISDLLNRCGLYGTVEAWRQLDKQQQSNESFTLSPLLVTFATIDEARWVKRKMDDQVFYANLLQVSYAPEYDTVNDIRLKLENRRTRVYSKLHHHAFDSNDGNKKKARRTNKQWRPQRQGDEYQDYVPSGSAATSMVIQGDELLETTGNTTTMEPSINGMIPHALAHTTTSNSRVATTSSSFIPPAPDPTIKKRRRI